MLALLVYRFAVAPTGDLLKGCFRDGCADHACSSTVSNRARPKPLMARQASNASGLELLDEVSAGTSSNGHHRKGGVLPGARGPRGAVHDEYVRRIPALR